MGKELKPSWELIKERYPKKAEKAQSGRSPISAIRLKCLECTCANAAEVRRCQIEECYLWPYRMGKMQNQENPDLDGDEENEISDECKDMDKYSS